MDRQSLWAGFLNACFDLIRNKRRVYALQSAYLATMPTSNSDVSRLNIERSSCHYNFQLFIPEDKYVYLNWDLSYVILLYVQ